MSQAANSIHAAHVDWKFLPPECVRLSVSNGIGEMRSNPTLPGFRAFGIKERAGNVN
jgi:hypothetical protein